MKVLLVTQWFDPEPVEPSVKMARGLMDLGHDVTVITGYPHWPYGKLYPGYRIRLCQREKIDGVPVVRVPEIPNHGTSGRERIIGLSSFAISLIAVGPFVSARPDVIHAIHPATVWTPTAMLARLWRVPYTIEIQDLWPDTLGATGLATHQVLLRHVGRYCRRHYAGAAMIRVISEGFKTRLIERGANPRKLRVIPNGVDLAAEGPVPVSADSKRGLGLSDRFVVMYAGTIGLAQHLTSVLVAADALRNAPVEFVFVGDGVDHVHLQDQTREMNLPNVRFLGRVPAQRMPSLYAMADALLLHLKADPLFEITIPHKVLSYLASGKPVVCAAAGDVADLVQRHNCGVVCSPDSPSDLAACLIRLMDVSVAERAQMGENGRRCVAEEYSLERTNMALSQMLLEALSATHPAGNQSLIA